MIEIPLLVEQIETERQLRRNVEYADSIRSNQLSKCMAHALVSNQIINDLSYDLKKEKKKTKRWKNVAVGGCTVSVGCLLVLLLTQ